MDLQDIHNWVRFQLKKERGGFITSPEIDSLLQRAQMWQYNDLFDVYGKTQKIEDSLSVFSTGFTYTSSASGLVTISNDATVIPSYQHLLSIYAQYYDNALQKTRYKPIKMLGEDEIAERLNSQILEPLVTDPVGIENSPGMIQLYPKVVISGNGFYLRLPAKPVFVYTLGADGRTITYNQAGSTQMEWNESNMNKILVKAIQFAGINLADNTVVQFNESKDQQDI